MEYTSHGRFYDVLAEPLSVTQHVDLGEFENSTHTIVRHVAEPDGEDGEAAAPTDPIFCEMFQITMAPDGDVWRERARWIKFEETVEEDGRRWSKPHVTLLSLTSIMQLKNCFKRGIVRLDASYKNFEEIVDDLTASWVAKHGMEEEEGEIIRDTLLLRKEHLIGAAFRSAPAKTEPSSPIKRKRSTNTPHTPDTDSEDEDRDAEPATPTGKDKSSVKKQAMAKKIIEGSVASVCLANKIDEVSTTLVAFIRFQEPIHLQNLPEVDIPTKFVFILLASSAHPPSEVTAVAKAFNVLMVDDVFSKIAHRATTNTVLAAAVDEFIGQSATIPAGKFSLDQRMEPAETIRKVHRHFRKTSRKMTLHGDHATTLSDLQRTGRIFGGLINDVKRKSKVYLSDFADAFRPAALMQCVAATIFLFLTNVTKIITFGGVMGLMLDNEMATMENLFSGGLCGVLYALFSGQPIAVLSATGPTLIFEFIMYSICGKMGWAFLPLRFWVGIWTCVVMLTFVAFDANALVAYVTKFTEEAFATLISIIYIYQAFEELGHIGENTPITTNPLDDRFDECYCNGSHVPYSAIFNGSFDMAEDCRKPMTHTGALCGFFPDVFLFSVVLFFCTFFISYSLKMLRHSGYFPSKIRNTISDFNVLIAVVAMTIANYFVGLQVPRLKIPEKFAPTLDRSWFVDPFDGIPTWLIFFAILPAFLFSILVIMDQNITSVIVNRKENKMRKGFGYHLDLAVVSILMIPCAFLGIPFYVAATVISIMHVDSLKMMSESAAPGEKPVFLGVREQRVTALLAHVLVGMTVVLTPVIKFIPLPVLLGIFLYMGIVSLKGQEFVQRIGLYITPVKYQPDYKFLRLVPLRRVHLFTLIQIFGLALLMIIKNIKPISISFPLTLIILMGIRKLIERFFTDRELLALDDPLPNFALLWKGGTGTADRPSAGSKVKFWRRLRRNNNNDYDVNGETKAALV